MLGFGAGPEYTNYNGFGSERPKNLQIQIRNTSFSFLNTAIIKQTVIVFFGCSKGGIVSKVLAVKQNSLFAKKTPEL
jgi:hypothetical protein